MSRVVVLPPEQAFTADGQRLGGWWHASDDGSRIQCDLCPRACSLKPGDRGFCFVRENRQGQMVLNTYGLSTGFCIDPIEKKPLNHFYPGSSVLSFGTGGCNLGCKFCQNWDISKSRDVARLSERADPEAIAEAARQLDCHSVAYTYNDPVIWAEYAIDTARACRAAGVCSVAVTAGYIMPAARGAFFREMDAANVDLKAFSEDFYRQLTSAHLQPVLDTLRWLKEETDVWFEITNLVIPGENDSHDELRRMCDWLLANVGPEVPVHFSAFHPDFRMRDASRTPTETLVAARQIAMDQGLRFAYVGNVDDAARQSTYCPGCGELLIERNWYELGAYRLRGSLCERCGHSIAGRFAAAPGNWGRKRQPVRIAQFARQAPPLYRAEQEVKQMTPGEPSADQAARVNVPAGPQLGPSQELVIHRYACDVVATAIRGQQAGLESGELGDIAELPVMGAFVTLRRGSRLRACCGALGKTMPLRHAVQQAAYRTAREDSRFPTISQIELPHLHVDVTLLYAFQEITARGRARIAAVEVGRHGLQIQRGDRSGLLLPSVPIEWGWDAEQFLAQLCRKADLPATAWMDDQSKLLRFEGRVIQGDFASPLALQELQPPLFSQQEMGELAEQCRLNVFALVQGATPNYYLPGCPDGTVELASISLHVPNYDRPLQFSQMSLRPGLPLQATLFQLVEAAAKSLRQRRAGRAELGGMRLELTVMADPAMHGSVDSPELDGLDPALRAVLVVEHGKSAWVFDPRRSPRELLEAAARDAAVASPATAAVFSLAALSTQTQAGSSSVPRPVAGPQIRPPAVAGMFYPGTAAELDQVLQQMLDAGGTAPESWPAIMVPHAGLIYSGKLAAATFQRVRIPETVVVIGPKHTRLGAEWAVTPHETWALPGGELAADPELAKRLAAAIPGLQVDAAAHQQEHSIEVQLPIIARLAPRSRVVGIVLGATDLAGCQRFATGLASFLAELPEPPLLVISSDMNHFANDAENRQLDEIALKAIETLDPVQVFDSVAGHNISMCGLRPCVVVMETLRQLGKLNRSERVGYATSAEVSGDKRRVVGYAGMLFG